MSITIWHAKTGKAHIQAHAIDVAECLGTGMWLSHPPGAPEAAPPPPANENVQVVGDLIDDSFILDGRTFKNNKEAADYFGTTMAAIRTRKARAKKAEEDTAQMPAVPFQTVDEVFAEKPEDGEQL